MASSSKNRTKKPAASAQATTNTQASTGHSQQEEVRWRNFNQRNANLIVDLAIAEASRHPGNDPVRLACMQVATTWMAYYGFNAQPAAGTTISRNLQQAPSVTAVAEQPLTFSAGANS
jgi:hypothetical protein